MENVYSLDTDQGVHYWVLKTHPEMHNSALVIWYIFLASSYVTWNTQHKQV